MLVASIMSTAQDKKKDIEMSSKKYKIGAAFGGGGAKAAAHCGALQAMKEYGIKPEIVSGTSAGALVAIYYASGYSHKRHRNRLANFIVYRQ